MNSTSMKSETARPGVPSIKHRLGKRACNSRISSHPSPARLTPPCAVRNAELASAGWRSTCFSKVVGKRGVNLVACGLASDETDAEVPLMDRIQPGSVARLFTPEELDTVLETIKDKVVVVQCKAKTCRPCMAFAKKFLRLADTYQDIRFFELYGDQNKATRKLMMQFGVKATPTFRIYSEGELQDTVVGINEKKVTKAILTPAGLWVEEEEENEKSSQKQASTVTPENGRSPQSKENELVEK